MATKSFWLSNKIDENKLNLVAKEQNKTVSKLINNLLIQKYDVFKEKKK